MFGPPTFGPYCYQLMVVPLVFKTYMGDARGIYVEQEKLASELRKDPTWSQIKVQPELTYAIIGAHISRPVNPTIFKQRLNKLLNGNNINDELEHVKVHINLILAARQRK